MIAAPFGSLALHLSPDLRTATKISPGSDKCHPLSWRWYQIYQNATAKANSQQQGTTNPVYIRSVFTQGNTS